MNIGRPQHEHYIEPLELPEPLRQNPDSQPTEAPVHQPEEEPVKKGKK